MGEKVKVAEYAEIHGNRKAGRDFNVDESMVRRWKKDKEMMAKQPAKKLSMRGGKPHWPKLEKKLKEFVISEASSGTPLSNLIIGQHAMVMAKKQGLKNFIGGSNWCARFMQRNRMSVDGEGGLCLHPKPQKVVMCQCGRTQLVDSHVGQLIIKDEV